MQDRIIGPVLPILRPAGALTVLAGLLWPAQAAALAWAIAGWAAGEAGRTVWAAMVFVLGGALRAALDYRAGAYLFEAADLTIARERSILIRREARDRANAGSAEIAAIVVQKLPMLQPWITRYHVAMVRLSVLPIVLLVLVFCLSWVAGLILLIAGPLIPVFMALVGVAAEQASRRQMDEIGSMNTMLMERLSAMLDIRLLGASRRATADFERRADALRVRTMAVLRVAFLSSTVLELFSALAVAMVAVFVGFSLLGEITFGSWDSPLGLGEGVFLLLIAPEFFQPFRDFAAAWHDRAAGFAVVEELDALDAAERLPFVGSAAPAEPLPGDLTLVVSGAIASLPGRDVALPDLSLTAGEALALTGPSGSGKSTILAAVAGLAPLHSGTITVAEQPLNLENADAWRARIAFIPQAPHFADQRLGDWLDVQGNGVDPWPALDLAWAREIVERLPDGLATRLGETGGGVSGGEARRLLIARAVMTGRELILADEPTADLDRETAKLITRALERLKEEGHTLIVATHDQALASAMDRQIEVAG